MATKHAQKKSSNRRSKPSAKSQRRKSHRTKASDETSVQLLKASAKIFAERGFDGATVQEIAKEAGVNVSLISYHFGGKKKLYQACLEQFGESRLQATQNILQPCATYEEFRIRLGIFITEFFETNLANRDLARMIHREVEEGLINAPEIFQKTFLRIFMTLRDFYADSIAKRHLRQNCNPLISARSLYSTMVHFLVSDYLSQKFIGVSLSDPNFRPEICKHLQLIFADGLQAVKSAKGRPIKES